MKNSLVTSLVGAILISSLSACTLFGGGQKSPSPTEVFPLKAGEVWELVSVSNAFAERYSLTVTPKAEKSDGITLVNAELTQENGKSGYGVSSGVTFGTLAYNKNGDTLSCSFKMSNFRLVSTQAEGERDELAGAKGGRTAVQDCTLKKIK